MNWKSEGYQVGNKAILVIKNSLCSNNYPIQQVEIIYVGTKILKVKKEDQIITFRNRYASEGLWGIGYCIYKSPEEYNLILEESNKRKKLIKEITYDLNKLSLIKLEQIKEIILK